MGLENILNSSLRKARSAATGAVLGAYLLGSTVGMGGCTTTKEISRKDLGTMWVQEEEPTMKVVTGTREEHTDFKRYKFADDLIIDYDNQQIMVGLSEQAVSQSETIETIRETYESKLIHSEEVTTRYSDSSVLGLKMLFSVGIGGLFYLASSLGLNRNCDLYYTNSYYEEDLADCLDDNERVKKTTPFIFLGASATAGIVSISIPFDKKNIEETDRTATKRRITDKKEDDTIYEQTASTDIDVLETTFVESATIIAESELIPHKAARYQVTNGIATIDVQLEPNSHYIFSDNCQERRKTNLELTAETVIHPNSEYRKDEMTYQVPVCRK
ncbi:MAG: hypothetical protein ABIG93_01785 [archaeon]|nr:hypothetical protein [Nanoarchaeota archaeon]